MKVYWKRFTRESDTLVVVAPNQIYNKKIIYTLVCNDVDSGYIVLCLASQIQIDAFIAGVCVCV